MINDHSTSTLIFLQIHLGGDRNFCYLLGDQSTGEAMAVDPGFDAPGFAAIAAQHGLTINKILITHGHSDHMEQAAALADATGAIVYADGQAHVLGAIALTDGQEFTLGSHTLTALATPGHSPGHYCFLCEGNLITGDLLFCGKIGGTGSYFKGSSPKQQFDSLEKIMQLPEAVLVFPGHDYYGGEGSMPHSSIGYEKANNPFLLAEDYAAFCHLKDNWAVYKKEHGIQ
jgi:glyoxylase-like metal-dependent hydrolase (beta-lactamase superfamily II)